MINCINCSFCKSVFREILGQQEREECPDLKGRRGIGETKDQRVQKVYRDLKVSDYLVKYMSHLSSIKSLVCDHEKWYVVYNLTVNPELIGCIRRSE